MMPARRNPRWSPAELALLHEHYPNGLDAAERELPGRSWHSIYVKASKLGIKNLKPAPPKEGCALSGTNLDEAVRLRIEEGWSFARIGVHFGVCEASACNAVTIERCHREGFTPARRLSNGRLAPESLERLRLMLRKGLKGIEIQLRLGVSAACVAEQRRRYNADLKARGKALLPPPGGGEAYSGVRVPREKVKAVEALFLDGWGTAKISAQTGVSKTVCTRIRNRLIKRLKRKGESLPGCDAHGKRRVVRGSLRAVPQESLDRLRAMILDRVPVARAARECGVGTCRAYRERDLLNEELGGMLPKPILPGYVRGLKAEALRARQIPAEHLQRFRELVHEHGDAEARRLLKAEIAESRRGMTFEERLAAVRDPSQIVAAFTPRRADPSGTLGGVASLAAVEAA